MAKQAKAEATTEEVTEEVAEDTVKPAVKPAVKEVFGSSVSKDDNFTITTKENGTVEVSPRPWEGPPALVTRRERIAELIKALQSL